MAFGGRGSAAIRIIAVKEKSINLRGGDRRTTLRSSFKIVALSAVTLSLNFMRGLFANDVGLFLGTRWRTNGADKSGEPHGAEIIIVN